METTSCCPTYGYTIAFGDSVVAFENPQIIPRLSVSWLDTEESLYATAAQCVRQSSEKCAGPIDWQW